MKSVLLTLALFFSMSTYSAHLTERENVSHLNEIKSFCFCDRTTNIEGRFNLIRVDISSGQSLQTWVDDFETRNECIQIIAKHPSCPK